MFFNAFQTLHKINAEYILCNLHKKEGYYYSAGTRFPFLHMQLGSRETRVIRSSAASRTWFTFSLRYSSKFLHLCCLRRGLEGLSGSANTHICFLFLGLWCLKKGKSGLQKERGSLNFWNSSIKEWMEAPLWARFIYSTILKQIAPLQHLNT